MSDDDLSKMFDEHDPAREVTDDEFDDVLSTAQLLERVHTETRRRRVLYLPHRWRRAGIITASAVIVLSGTAAAISLLSAPATNTTDLACFSSPAIHSSASIVSLSAHPLSTCEELMHWSSSTAKGGQNGVLCVLSNGSLGGFPTTRKSGECQTLGLMPYDGHASDVPAASFQEAAQNYFAAHQCDTLAKARAEVAQLLARHRVNGWRVLLRGSASPGACATLAVEAGKKTVDIVGVKF